MILRRIAGLLGSAWVEYERDHARYLAVAMVYYALVSLVPLLLLLLATLGLLLRFSGTAADAERHVLSGIEARLGPEVGEATTRLFDTLQRESIVATAVGVAAILLTASVLFRHLRLSFRAMWKYEPPLVSGSVRAVVWVSILEKIISFAMLLGGGALLLVALVLIAAQQWLDRLLGRLDLVSPASGWLLTAAGSFILAVVTFAALFKFLPPVAVRWRDVWFGALLCGIGWIVASEILALYGVFFGGSAYGALGGMLALMLWMNVVSQVLFYGAELCKVVATQGAASR